MKRRYIVTKSFVNSTLGKLRVAYVVPHNKLKYLTEEEITENIFIQDYSQVRLPFNWGLIFLSKEFPFQQYHEDETRECIEQRLLCEIVKTCK